MNVDIEKIIAVKLIYLTINWDLITKRDALKALYGWACMWLYV